jgi:tRNA(fMet)-specific endonuclease VapC
LEVKKILLDTNAYAALMAGNDDVLIVLSAAETIYISVIVLGELLEGFKGGNKERENRKRLDTFLEKPTVKILNATAETSEIYAEIKTALRKSGTPIPIHDVWIAAHAQESGAAVVTFDKHFEKVPGIRLWN